LPNKHTIENLQSSKNLPTIKCECGKEILLIPDLKAMSKAIETHAFEHGKNKNLEKTASEVEHILDFLTMQVLQKILEHY
jgi:hypothetical protein